MTARSPLNNSPGQTTVTIVTYNSAEYIETCVRSLLEQSLSPKDIIVTDNGSSDQSVSILQHTFGSRIRLIRNHHNCGFSVPHNVAIRRSQSAYVLVLNPDTKLQSDFIEKLSSFLDHHPGLGSATGKLLRMTRDGQPLRKNGAPIIDSTGMYFLPNQRHADRGAGEPDLGQYADRRLVFGTTAAAGLYRRNMLEDIRLEGEFFDEGFFLYREDVDLAWRSVLYGWACGYEPGAIAYHVRFGIPERRHLLSPEINYHSVKNRFLLRMKNMTLGSYVRHFPSISFRDLLVIGYSILKEHRSLSALPFLLQNRHKYVHLRHLIGRKRRLPKKEIEKWIGWKPRTYPFRPPPSPVDGMS